MQGGKLLINIMLKAKRELWSIVIVNDFQAVKMLIVQPQSQALKVLNTSSLLSKKKIQE
jgi:glucokinase